METQTQTQIEGVPFTFLGSLFREIAAIAPRDAKSTRGIRSRERGAKDPPALILFKQWLEELRRRFSPLPKGTAAICFRLIFPHEDHKRKYDMQEKTLSKALLKCFDPGNKNAQFNSWDGEDASGCLGQELRWYIEERTSYSENYLTPLSIHQVDALLSELACHSQYTDASIRSRYSQPPRPRAQILADLFRKSRPDDASYIVQIILKDMRPLLYPVEGSLSFVAALRYYNTKAVTILSKEDAMRAWDPSGMMPKASHVFSDMDRACEIYELPTGQRPQLVPIVGTMVEITKSRKAQRCSQALDFLKESEAIWAEIKYDGERAQIHVELQPRVPPKITIFSKSKRDSTSDRVALHPIICEALGLTARPSQEKVKQAVILDAEMVAFKDDRIDEFWRIRRLIEKTAEGVRRRSSKKKKKANIEDSQISAGMISDDDDDDENRCLGLVIFDILFLDGESLLFTPYTERRALLERIIRCQPGRIILSRRFLVDMHSPNPRATLRRIFAEQIADHQEGLMLKASESYYNDFRLPWVKLKKDYIPGFGDTLDMVLVGASWDKERGRELRVGPGTYTTFYIGTFKDRHAPKPHIEVFYTASYGLSRGKIEDLNALIRSVDSFKYPLREGCKPESYTFKLLPSLPPPTVMLQEPVMVELFGAGFTKSQGSHRYELRFPRIEKIFRPAERTWKDAVDLRQLHDIALNSVGRDREQKTIDDEVMEMFKASCSPGVKCPKKRQEAAESWAKALCKMDGDIGDMEDDKVEVPPASASLKRPKSETALDPDSDSDIDLFLPPKRLCPDSQASPRILTSSPICITPDPLETPDSRLPGPSVRPSKLRHYLSPHPLDTVTNRPLATPPSSPIRLPPFIHSLPLPILPEVPSQCMASPTRSLATDKKPPKDVCPPALLETFVYFERSSESRCKTCKRLSKSLQTGRPIHTLAALLAGCGYGNGPAGLFTKHGAIIVDCQSFPSEEEVVRYVDIVAESVRRLSVGSITVPLSIWRCDSFVDEKGSIYNPDPNPCHKLR